MVLHSSSFVFFIYVIYLPLSYSSWFPTSQPSRHQLAVLPGWEPSGPFVTLSSSLLLQLRQLHPPHLKAFGGGKTYVGE